MEVGNDFSLISKQIHRIRYLVVCELVVGVSISSFLSLFSHIASFIALSAMGGFLGGTILCESLFENFQ